MPDTRSGASARVLKPSRLFRRSVAVGAALTAVLLFPMAEVVSAHYVYENLRVLNIGNFCMDIRSEVSHGSYDGGYYKGNVNIYGPDSIGNPCAWSYSQPPHTLRMKMWQWYQPINGSAGVCSATNLAENIVSLSNMQQVVNHGSSTPTCGHGWYENEARGYAVWNGVWQTASLYSGRHCLNPNNAVCSGK